MSTPQLFLLSLVMMSGATDESGQATIEEMKAAYLQNANSLNSVQARWSIKKTPEIGAIHSHEYQVSVGKDNIKGGRGDAVFERMANSKPPEATEWWGQLVRNQTGTQLAFVNPLNAGTPKPDEPLPLPLTSEQFQDDLHNGWSIFGWADANEPVRCMIGQRHRGLLAGAVLQQLPDSPEFQFPPLLSPTENFGGVRHPFDELFDHDLEAMGEVDLEGRRYQLVQSLAEPIPYSQMEIPESLHGRYQVFPRVRAWLDPEHWYLPVRIESDNMVQFDGVEVKVNKGSISDRVLTAELDVIDIDGQQVSYPKQLVVETRRIDPTYQGPYEDDVVGILNGTVPLPDYPYVSDWSVAWSVEVAAFPKDVDLSLEFPDQTFYMDQSRAVAMFVGEGARDALAVHPQTHVEPLKRFNWILWGNMALIITILGTLFLRRRLKRVA